MIDLAAAGAIVDLPFPIGIRVPWDQKNCRTELVCCYRRTIRCLLSAVRSFERRQAATRYAIASPVQLLIQPIVVKEW